MSDSKFRTAETSGVGATGFARKAPLAAVAVLALLSASCASDGNFCILGYTTKPNYDAGIKTVRVPIFKNVTFYRGLEFDLTRAVIREIGAKTPYRVVSADCPADSELSGKIINLTKNIINRTQLNEVREGETILAVEVVWLDLRSGEVLSKQRANRDAPPVIVGPNDKPPPILIQSSSGFIEELGESTTTAQKRNVDRLAIQIVSMMEIPW